MMSINDEKLIKMIKGLPQFARQSAYDYLNYLTSRYGHPPWYDIGETKPEQNETPFSEGDQEYLEYYDDDIGAPWFDDYDEHQDPNSL
jgi:hypothetical protein